MRVRGYPAGVPCWTQLHTPDPLGSARFYRELLGWTAGPDGVFRLADWAAAGLVAAEDGPAGWISYVATDDADATLADAVAAGAVVLAPVAQCPPGGRTALLRDPAGAVIGLWQRVAFAGAQVGGEPGTVCWTDLATGDPTASESFYGKVFGWKATVSDYSGEAADGAPNYLDFSAAERVVAGVRVLPPEVAAKVPAHWLVTFDVDGHAQALAGCLARGARLLYGPEDVGVGTYAQLLDPHGAAFGLIELSSALRLP